MSAGLVTAGIDQGLRQLVATSNNTFGLRRKLKTNVRSLRKLQSIADQEDDQSPFWSDAPQVATMALNGPWTPENPAKLRRLLEYAYLLHQLKRPQMVSFSTVSVARPLAQIADNYTDQLEWSDFVESLFNQLSSYEVQSNRHKYNVADLANFGQGDEGGAQGITVQRNQLDVFFNQLASAGFMQDGENSIDPQAVSDDWLRELNQLLEVTLKEDLEPQEDGGVLTFKRSFVCLKDVVAKIAGRTDLKTLRVFAAHTIYVDANLELPETNVSIIAPNLKSVGQTEWVINTSGRDASNYTEPASDGQLRNDSAIEPTPAKQGNPGGDAGDFLLLVKKADFGCMKVIANGGKGGQGQTGGKGTPGRDGHDVQRIWEAPGAHPVGDYHLDYEYSDFLGAKKFKDYYCYANSPGEIGHKGGVGGMGGRGGNFGTVLVRHTGLSCTTEPGLGGPGGAGGAGGESGKDGTDARCRIVYDHFKAGWFAEYTDCDPFPRRDPGPYGDQGPQGPAGSTKTSQSIVLDLNAFRAYMLSKSSNRLLSDVLSAFRLYINQWTVLDKYYDAKSLIDALVQLIDHQCEPDQSFELAVYENLLELVENFAQTQVSESTSKQELTALHYLYASTLSKVCRLRRAAEGFLIVNMDIALQGALDNIKKLANSEALAVVDKSKKHFSADIEVMIREGQVLLEKHIFPEIESIQWLTRDRISDLLKEIQGLKEKVEDDQKALRSLRSVIVLSAVLESVVVVGKVVATLFGFGAAAEAVGKGASMGIKKLGSALADQDRPSKITKLPDGAKDSMVQARLEAKLKVEQKADALIRKIDGIDKIISEHVQTPAVRMLAAAPKETSDLGSLSDTMKALKAEVSTAKKELADKPVELNKKIDSIGSKVDTAVKKESTLAKKAVEEAKSDGEKKSAEKTSKAMSKMDILKTVGSGAMELVGVVTETMGKMNEYQKATEELEKTLGGLNDFKDSIMNTTTPMIENIFNNMNNLETQLAGESQVSLEFNKWQIKDKLGDLRELLKQMTEGFEVQDELARTIAKLDEAMTTVVTMYDRMQTYQSQAKLADHIAVIGGASLGNVGVTDPDLKAAVLKMDVAARRDLLMEQYEASLAAMKQWVFPFADRYLPEFAVPASLKLDSGVDAMVATTSKCIETMRSRVRDYVSRIMAADEIVKSGVFGDASIHTTPFYTWTGARYQRQIEAFLAGQPITLLANVVGSPAGKGAIKFNRIELQLMSSSSNQNELNRLLEAFEIDLTHSGTSYYRVRHSYYQIASTSLLMSYSVHRKPDGSPAICNNVYSKLLSGDLMLSPYTLWTMRLRKSSPSANFDALKQYAANLDLRLVGEASYVDERRGTRRLELNLDKYNYEHAIVTNVQ